MMFKEKFVGSLLDRIEHHLATNAALKAENEKLTAVIEDYKKAKLGAHNG